MSLAAKRLFVLALASVGLEFAVMQNLPLLGLEGIWFSLADSLILGLSVFLLGVLVSRLWIGARRDLSRGQRIREEALSAAEKTVQARDEFLATVSHEIRTPLYGVLGMGELLATTELSEEQSEYVRALTSSGKALLSLANEVLDLSKIEAGRLELECTQFDLGGLVEEAALVVANKAYSKGLELAVDVHSDVPCNLRGDPNRLRQVLLNLLENAVKFTAAGHVILRVRTADGTSSAPLLRLEVEDTGIGIAEEDRDRLFEAFAQAEASTARRFGGTGLGLTISRRLVQAMGGSIQVEETPGGGSRFVCRLPFDAVDHAQMPRARDDERRVVVAVSLPLTRSLIAERLRAQGCEVLECEPEDLLGCSGDIARDLVLVEFTRAEAAVELIESLPGQAGLAKARRVLVAPLPNSSAARAFVDSGTCDAVLTLPASRSAIDSLLDLGEAKRAVSARMLVEAPDFTGHRVLLVDDDAVSRRLISLLLERVGVLCDQAENGQEALDALDHTAYDLVLMDRSMPEVDGFEATSEIRASFAPAKDVPIVAITASVLQSDRDRCREVGMNDYLSKPVKGVALYRLLEKWLRQPASSD